KIEGLVTVAIVIGEDGNVISAKAKSGPDALRPAAEDAARKARFRPTTVDDKPAKVSGVLSYNFVSKN
ncbi:MAG TPA: TonB family protein, partial [Pyrinomonadaceae bacterium]|nr:TonB family protein [Pyrinomonadaceae bacterium]